MKTPSKPFVATFALSLFLVACGNNSNLESRSIMAISTPLAGSMGTAKVFMSNPVQSTGIQTLTDQKDANTAVPSSAYYQVSLSHLDGSGYLRGDYANVLSETGNPANSATNTFNFSRKDDQFEQVMAYFWVTEAQLYLQSLGFGSEFPAVNRESQDVRINQLGADNSFSLEKKDVLRFGKGGVDDAEDGEVIVHEYGHAVHDSQVAGFGSSLEAGSIGEAFGDYLAVTVGLSVAGKYNVAINANPACVADWDATSYTSSQPHCLRRVDTNKTVANKIGEVHADGEIWSRALWDIRGALGAYKADRIIIDAQFQFAANTSFSSAAGVTVRKAMSLYGSSAAQFVTNAFNARGIIAL
jgi:zinc metalloprotease ZmpB